MIDYEQIGDDLLKRIDDVVFFDERNWKIFVTSTWNIVNSCDGSNNREVYETIINGMSNAFNAGYDFYQYNKQKCM